MQTAKNIVKYLDKYIIGHESAKRMVAIAVVNSCLLYTSPSPRDS